ncbi:hypothetical protein FRB91_002977 [Serendipita sp. 411]|nr:hypothetical protein FRB91_002977 [Serendipita sp. 411]KAG9043433.1 hypothetical protein FS842_001823 [Serendipita sp. 407]
MSTQFTRTLYIVNQGDLPDDTTLMLSFEPIEGLYRDTYPVCWRVGTFAAEKPGAMIVTYKNQLAYTRPQVLNGNIVSCSTWQNINVGQKTTLNKNSNGVYSFDGVSAGQDGYLIAANNCGDIQEMSIGFETTPGMPPSQVLYFDNIGQGSNVTTQFTPLLSAYVTSQYQQTEILRGEIQTPNIWTQDLAKLKETTTLIFSRNKATGQYSLKPVEFV